MDDIVYNRDTDINSFIDELLTKVGIKNGLDSKYWLIDPMGDKVIFGDGSLTLISPASSEAKVWLRQGNEFKEFPVDEDEYQAIYHQVDCGLRLEGGVMKTKCNSTICSFSNYVTRCIERVTE